jgi:hypothetical protein
VNLAKFKQSVLGSALKAVLVVMLAGGTAAIAYADEECEAGCQRTLDDDTANENDLYNAALANCHNAYVTANTACGVNAIAATAAASATALAAAAVCWVTAIFGPACVLAVYLTLDATLAGILAYEVACKINASVAKAQCEADQGNLHNARMAAIQRKYNRCIDDCNGNGG